jgi:hypothetical protein
MEHSATLETTHLARATALACAGAAVLCVVVGLVVGHPGGGGLVALGLLIGAGNVPLAQLMQRFGLPIGSSNMARLGMLTGVVLVAAFAVGLSRAWLLILGVAGAQLVLSVTAAVEMARR